jgi:tetratricopeptide (TPR) repeat protein
LEDYVMENPWYTKAVGFVKLERYKVALHCCDRALEINPRDWEILILKGGIMEKLGEHDEALKCYDRATEANPRSAQAWYNRGAALGNFGQYQKALGCFQEAQRQGHPNAADAVKECQEALSREGFHPRAKQAPAKPKQKFR